MRYFRSIIALILLGFSGFTLAADGGTVQIHLEDLTPDQQAILTQLKAAANDTATAKARTAKVKEAAKQIREITSVGGQIANDIADAIVTLVDRLGVEVNEFIVSPAGTWTIAIILLYLFGGTIWTLTVGTGAYVMLMFGLWRLAKRFVIPERIVTYDKDNPDQITKIQYVMPYEFENGESKSAMFIAFIIFSVVLTATWFFKIV